MGGLLGYMAFGGFLFFLLFLFDVSMILKFTPMMFDHVFFKKMPTMFCFKFSVLHNNYWSYYMSVYVLYRFVNNTVSIYCCSCLCLF